MNKIVAKTRTGIEIECKIWIENIEVKTQYPIAKHPTMHKWMIILSKKEMKDVFNFNSPATRNYIEVLNQEDGEKFSTWRSETEKRLKQEKLENMKIVSFIYIQGCDCASTIEFSYDQGYLYERQQKDETMAKICSKLVQDNPEKYNAIFQEDTTSSYGGWKVEEKIEELLADAELEVIKSQEQKQVSDREKKINSDIKKVVISYETIDNSFGDNPEGDWIDIKIKNQNAAKCAMIIMWILIRAYSMSKSEALKQAWEKYKAL